MNIRRSCWLSGYAVLLCAVSAVANAVTVSGDFNGDGRTDIATIFNENGLASVDVRLSTGTAFVTHARWATQQGGFWGTQKWMSGDFDGDGRADLANVHNCGNNYACINVHLSNGTSFPTYQSWAGYQGGYWDAQKWMSGDFNGDGMTDLANAHNCGNNYACINVHLSNGTSFPTYQSWAGYQGGYWDAQKWLSGDFNGDGSADLANVFNCSNYACIDVHLSNGSSFPTFARWENYAGGFWDAQKWLSGDFNGDGLSDIANVFNDANLASVDVHVASGSGFSIQRWATRQGGFWDAQEWLAGKFTADGNTDLENTHNNNGAFAANVHPSDGASFYTYQQWVTIVCTTVNVPWFEGSYWCRTRSGYAQSEYGFGYSSQPSDVWVYDPNIEEWDVCIAETQLPFAGYQTFQQCTN